MLTDEQRAAAEGILKDIKRKQEVALGGHAGTGKSTLVRYLRECLPNFAVCAFTGKATNVLRKKGLTDAATIHSLIYVPIPLPKGDVEFELRSSVDWNGFIVDESSMVNTELYEDLKSFGLPMIFIGDHGQLEPVGKNPNLMKSPDYRLEKVHRNAGEIAHFAEWIRLGKNVDEFAAENKVQVVQAFNKKLMLANKGVVTGVDQIICAYNATRKEFNERVRCYLGLDGKVKVGDRVMCLRNNKKIGLFNGMQGYVNSMRKGNVFDFATETGLIEKVPYHPAVFGTEKIPEDIDLDGTNPFDYAYCITAHKSQGDEWDSVMVIEQICKNWDHVRWAYTAASRAKEQLIWLGAYRKREDLEGGDNNDWF